MTATPLLDRIAARKPQREPTPITERMSPFLRRLRDKQLPVKDTTSLHDVGPDGTGGA